MLLHRLGLQVTLCKERFLIAIAKSLVMGEVSMGEGDDRNWVADRLR